MREDSLQILYRLDPNPRKASSKADELKYWIDQLENRMVRQCTPVSGWEMKSCYYHGYENYTDLDNWHPVSLGEHWGGDDVTGFFRASAIMPEVLEDAQVFLNLSFGGEALLSINGVPHQGIDFDRKYANLDRYFSSGEKLELFVEASVRNAPYDSFRDDIRVHHVFEAAEILQIDRTVEDLYYYCWVIYDVIKASQEPEYIAFLENHLQQALKKIDYRSRDFEVFKSGVREAIAYIRKNIYESRAFHKNGKVSIIGQSHLDLVYLWSYREFLRKNPRTAMNMVRNLDEFPEFRFSQSQAKMYDELRTKYPKAYEAVQEKIREGSWEPVGAFYVEPDCNLIGGESMIRQIAFGKDYYRREFGNDPEICWIPDVFGCMWTMPQILKKCGVNYLSTIKLAIWNDTNPFPYSQFWWEGPDGSRVLTYFPSTHFVSSVEPAKICEAWDKNLQKDITGESIFQFGLADGGGGATRDMVARMSHIRGLPGMPEMEFDTLSNVFHRIEEKSAALPVWQNELYLETHRGTYTTKGQIKKANRQLEFSLHEAEFFNAVARQFGGESVQKQLNSAWEKVMVNQFHDIIPGSHVTEAAEDAMKLYGQAQEEVAKAAEQSLKVITGKIGGNGQIAVFNALSWERDDLVKIAVLAGKSFTGVRDCVTGEILPCIPCGEEKEQNQICFLAEKVPSMGYKLFELIEGEPVEQPEAIQDYLAETEQFRLVFDENGEIQSLYDKIYARELVQGAPANHFCIFEDRPGKYSAWDIIPSYQEYEYQNASALKQISVVEKNSIRTVVRVVKTILDSTIEQNIVLYEKLHRVDFETHIDWKEREKLLKVAFPVAVHAREASYDLPFGSIQRPTHQSTSWDRAKFEVYGHKWADLSEHDFGVSILTDCKYGYDIRGNVMRLTLLKAPIYPDPFSDLGEHDFCYSLYPHAGQWQEGRTMQAGYQLNMPLWAVVLHENGEAAQKQESWFASGSENIILETVKESFDGTSLVIRAYDAYGQRGKAELYNAFAGNKAVKTNLLEQREGEEELEITNHFLRAEYGPFEILTVQY